MKTFSSRLRAQCDRIWAGLHAHPFLGELARGTLPLDRFRFFIEQDLLYLPAFARCMAMGAAKSAREAAEEFVRGDPIVLHGVVQNWFIRDWIEALVPEK